MEDKLMVIVNPSSGQGRGARFIKELEHMLRAENLDAEIVVSQSERHMRTLFSEGAVNESLLVAVGGDTTFTIMAQELWRQKQATGCEVAEMAWIGVGSANDILRDVGLDKPNDVVRALKSGQTLSITLGEICADGGEPELFLGSVGFGAAPRGNEAIARAKELGKRSSLRAEWGPVLAALWKGFRSGELPFNFDLEIQHGRGLSGTASLFLILNAPHFSRGINVNDFASLDSPALDWTVLACDSLFSLWRMQLRLQRQGGKVIHPDIQVGQSKQGTLRFLTPQRYLIDGELRGPTRELHFRAIPEALRLRVPGLGI